MKRQLNSHTGAGPRKKAKRAAKPSAASTPIGPDHPVLQRLYPKVLTLRNYLLSRLPKSSKNRRRRLSQLGLGTPAQDDTSTRDVDIRLGQLLDSTLIGCFSPVAPRDFAQELKERELYAAAFAKHLGWDLPAWLFSAKRGRLSGTRHYFNALHVAMLSDPEAE
jgi:hypothetical protein